MARKNLVRWHCIEDDLEHLRQREVVMTSDRNGEPTEKPIESVVRVPNDKEHKGDAHQAPLVFDRKCQ